jgi:hypothetical protein
LLICLQILLDNQNRRPDFVSEQGTCPKIRQTKYHFGG